MLPERVVMETLMVSNMIKNKHLAKSISEQNFYFFIQTMKYKCEEYDIEFAMRKKYASGMTDCIICGALTDEWRMARYMHACHVSMDHGEFFRYAGNTVFPNGFIDMELIRPLNGGKLLIYGDTTETATFRIELDGSAPIETHFNTDGIAEFSVPAGNAPVKIRLSKAPGPFYPRFRAVATK